MLLATEMIWDGKGVEMERLSIDEVIEHCERKVDQIEKFEDIETLVIACIDTFPINDYWRYKQTKEWLEELKSYRDAEEQGLLLKLPEEMSGLDKNVLRLAIEKAVTLCRYGVDIDSRLTTATELSCALHDAYMRGRKHEIDRMKVVEQEIRNKAIDEFANVLNNSPNIHKWACRDLTLEFCNGDNCDECENEFMEEIYQIAEQMKEV